MRPHGWVARLVVGITLLSQLGACGSSASPSQPWASLTPTATAAATSGLTPSASTAASLPRARTYGSMVSLGSDGGVLLLEGNVGYPPPWGTGVYLRDVWRYNSQGGWRRVADKPQPKDFLWGSATFDARAGLVIVATTTANAAPPKPPPTYDLLYNPQADRWETRASRGGWFEINGAPIVYDSAADRAILFGGGGTGNTCNDETWVYDLSADTWTRATPKVSPPAENFGSMVYDEKADRAILWAVDCNGFYAGTWTYDVRSDTWTDLKPATSPPGRVYAAMAYDPKVDKTILFGGVDESTGETVFGDTWVYSLASNSWTQLSPAVAPSARGWAAMAYEADSGKLVLFGGGTGRAAPLADTWLYDAAANAWTQGLP